MIATTIRNGYTTYTFTEATNRQMQAEYDRTRDQVTAGNTEDENLQITDRLDQLEDEAADRGFRLRRN